MSTMSIQNVQNKMKRQALRSKPAPEEIRKVIELENCLPHDQEVPTMNDILREQFNAAIRYDQEDLEAMESGRQPRVSSEDRDVETYRNILQKLPDKLQNYIGPVTKENTHEIFVKLCNLSQTISLIRDIASKNQKNAEFLLVYTIPTDVVITTDKNGRIIYVSSPLLEALKGVEAARIRKCQLCMKVFWAGRIDQPCCSIQCARNLRARRWRERYREIYKTQRIDKAQKDESDGFKPRRKTRLTK